MITILGFDPGEVHTAWAFVRDGKLLQCGELKRWHRVEDLITDTFPTVVVAEDFRLYPSKAAAQSGNQIWTARVLGVLQYVCEKYDIQFELQMASRIRNDPKVKRLKTGKSKHVDDAFKHAMAYYFTHYTEVYRAKHRN